MGTGCVVLAATPIGNLGDASPRLREALATADVIAAEDTRRLRTLASSLQVKITGQVRSHHEHNEADQVAELLGAARAGATVVVVTDAGMPTLSDPGFALVRGAAAAGVPVRVVPGPSAVVTALAVSGLPTDRFCFEGFLPRQRGERARAVKALAGEARTMVFFESPHRLAETLELLAAHLGPDRPAAVCRELTKLHEETVRGGLGELAQWALAEPVRGEIVIVVGGAAPEPADLAALVPVVLARVDSGERLKDVVAEVAAASGASRRELYAAAVAARS